MPAAEPLVLKEGQIVEGPFWPEPIEIEKIKEIGEYKKIIGVMIHSRKFVERLLSMEEIQALKVKEFFLTFTSPGKEAFIALEAERYRFASMFDPLLAMSTSKIDPLPFQIEAVYGYILKLPRIRFLIADDPGAGKTIMAGLIIKELKLRGVAHRILIVTPGHLKDQWRRELKDKFQEKFVLIDRGLINSLHGENPWSRESQVITSIDFAKKEDIMRSLEAVRWDLVVVDEAHKMAAYKYGNKLQKTGRYKLGELLSRTSEHLLFLTATPHKGDPENYRLFMDLLVPGFFATKELINESIKNRDNPLFIRRMKEDLKDFEGKPIFTRRFAKTIKYHLSPKERDLYMELSSYVTELYNKALKNDKKRNIAFALLILQRRMASSTYALLESLKRRKKRLEELLEHSRDLSKEESVPVMTMEDLEELEDYEEERRWEIEKKLEALTIVKDREGLKEEIKVLSRLIDRAREILHEEVEVKISELKKAIEEGLKKIEELEGKRKILIFTESRDTLKYLVKKIESWGYSVNYIHGGMKLEERIKAEKVFKHETDIMVATDAAGEGINLQFCHIMINNDLPWNPNRLEQRMGRIHRYGQQKDVYIFNLVSEDTREGKVFIKLFEKIEEIRKALNSDKVFDVIGDVFEGVNLYKLLIDAASNARSLQDIINELEVDYDEEKVRELKEKVLGESLATRNIDYTRLNEIAEKAREYRLIPEYLEEFFKMAFERAGGKFRVRKDSFLTIESVPYEIRKIAENQNFKNKYGEILRSYPRATFDKDIAFKNPDAEFISFGHPLLEAVLEWVKGHYFRSLKKGALFKDPDGKYNGVIWFFEGEIRDGKGDIAGKKLLAVYDDGVNLREINPSVLWDFSPVDNDEVKDVSFNREGASYHAIKALENYKEELEKERLRQAEIKKKYGVKSLEYLIRRLDNDLAQLYDRQATGEKVDLVIRNKEERKRIYENSLEQLKKDIELEKTLTMAEPKLIGAILVQPEIGKEGVSDEKIEKIGMEIAMEYERQHGRIPEDVSKENLGFDIKSRKGKEMRYIEVKARSNVGPVALTKNEWFKARRFAEQYYLYVVLNAATRPELYIIKNPALSLRPEEKVEIVRYVVSLEEILKKGGKEI